MKEFFSKILLFGEYSILKGSAALTIPFRKHYGNLELPVSDKSSLEQVQSNRILMQLFNYLSTNKSILEAGFNISAFKSDLDRGIFLQSNIPQNYGLGSSGALVASLFSQYLDGLENYPLLEAKRIMAEAESFFHSKSSGIDPLSCYANSPLHFETGSVHSIEYELLKPLLKHCYLLDTGQAATTEKFVATFFDKMEEDSLKTALLEYVKVVDKIIETIIRGEVEGLEILFKEISDFQFHYFSDMIPYSIRPLWKKGLDENHFYFKLCGSGGGGYMLVYSKLKKLKLKEKLGSDVIPII